MKKILLLLLLFAGASLGFSQSNPAITSFLQNTTLTGSYYVQGNSTTIGNGILVNCQRVEYSNDFVYITATGIPSYPTGPFLDGNPSQAQNQNSIFQLPLNPQPNTGNPIATTPGNIGIFINGVALFDYRDGVAWNPTTNALCGGPGNPPCPGGPGASQDWNRDAIPAERPGFDCSKGHPAMGNYHHHQNPSAFKLDLQVVSMVCNLYDADGLYAIDSTQHSPLIGFAYDGFPIYGAYAHQDTNGTGPIVRMKSGYSLRNITQRTLGPNGQSVDPGPAVDATYFLGYFREDYEFNASPATDVLDEHNGRWCRTPEYPNGTYAYFATVDANWNSAYPYAVGPTFYGNATNRSVNSITEPTTVYTGATAIDEDALPGFNIVPNPAADLVAVQLGGLLTENARIQLMDLRGKVIAEKLIPAGSTIAYFEVETVYSGTYLIRVTQGAHQATRKVVIAH
ncbi:MAG: YHYH protein [Bacteroidota bacterium]